MAKTLVITEKPSVGRDISRVLGCSQKGEGFLFSDSHIVSWAVGHLVTLYEPEDYDKALKKWDMKALPIIPGEMKLKPLVKTRKQFQTLAKLMNSANVRDIICATDSGREGELIFRYVYGLSGCVKPVKRLWISSMTDRAIKDGFGRLKDISEYDSLYASAKCRAEADWLVGMNASRAYTLAHGALYPMGRVQTPTLAMLVDRQNEINAFVPKDYWEVEGAFNTATASYAGVWFDEKADSRDSAKIFDKEKALGIVKKTKGKEGFVKSVTVERKRVPPGLLHDLTELQRECNARYGFPASKTLGVAQFLYEKKMITYPRTDSRHLTGDMAPMLADIVGRLNFGSYAEFAGPILDKKPLTAKRVIDDGKVSDHHAIIPTDSKPATDSLTPDQMKVYDLIARRFLSVFMPDQVYDATRIITSVDGETFLTKGKTVIQPGFTEIYKSLGDNGGKEGEGNSGNAKRSVRASKENEQEDGFEREIPKLKEGEGVTAKDAKILQKRTQPPKQYTEGTLLSAMENAGRFTDDESLKEKLKESGLGTPATRAAIIEKLIASGYAVRKGRALSPTEKGALLISLAPNEMKSPETTGKWEKGLSGIAKGSIDPERFMESIRRYVEFIVKSAVKNDERL